jgi:hypothetical protein
MRFFPSGPVRNLAPGGANATGSPAGPRTRKDDADCGSLDLWCQAKTPQYVGGRLRKRQQALLSSRKPRMAHSAWPDLDLTSTMLLDPTPIAGARSNCC